MQKTKIITTVITTNKLPRWFSSRICRIDCKHKRYALTWNLKQAEVWATSSNSINYYYWNSILLVIKTSLNLCLLLNYHLIAYNSHYLLFKISICLSCELPKYYLRFQGLIYVLPNAILRHVSLRRGFSGSKTQHSRSTSSKTFQNVWRLSKWRSNCRHTSHKFSAFTQHKQLYKFEKRSWY